MRLKLDPVFIDLSEALERKHLISSRVGEERMRPGHESVKPAELRDHLFTGANVQMVSIREDDSSTGRFQVVR
jgi:hypothetical protein